MIRRREGWGCFLRPGLGPIFALYTLVNLREVRTRGTQLKMSKLQTAGLKPAAVACESRSNGANWIKVCKSSKNISSRSQIDDDLRAA